MKYTISFKPNRKTPWKVEFRKSANEKLAKFFSSELEALVAAENLSKIIDTGGFAEVRAGKGGLTVSKALAQFSKNRTDTGQHGVHMRRILGDFEKAHGKKELSSITPMLLDQYWDRPNWPAGNATRRQVYAYLRIFFNWCERYEILEKNPIKRVDAPPVAKPLKNILSPAQMRKLLKRSVELGFCDVQAHLALCGFGGLRTAEFQALTMDCIDRESLEIHVRGGKTGERFVKILPALLRWLPGNWKLCTDRNFRRHRDMVAEGIGWGRNWLRHSFATYHLALSGNAGETAHQMGHSDSRMVSRVYALAARRAAGDEWWGV